MGRDNRWRMPRQAATDTPHVSVIVLVYNEVDSVEPLHRELIGVLDGLGTSFEVVYVDDGSRDGSTERLGQIAARDGRVRVISFRRNFGQSAAMQAGIDHSRGDVLVFMDGDMQNDPHDIPHLLEKVDEGYEVVSGWRHERRGDATRVVPSRIASWIIARATGVDVSDFGCTLKAFRRDVINDVQLHGEMHRLVPVYASMVGARMTELPVNFRPRTYGRSKYSPSRASRVLLDLISLRLLGGYSARPIYFFGFAAATVWALALVFAAIVVGQRLLAPYVPAINNPFLLLAVVLVIVGVQLFVTGLLAERPIRKSRDVQVAPPYVVREVIEKPVHRQPATDGRHAARPR
jgi:glycosyltransferase involved in cell wall biosynthesis